MFESDHSNAANLPDKEGGKPKKTKRKDVTEPLYSPKKVAAAIGASESSLKRWCDAGVVKAVKTPGGHRKIARSEVLAFAKRKKYHLRDPLAIGLPDINAVDFSSIDQAKTSFLTAVIGSDSISSHKILCALFIQGHSIAAIFDTVVSPVFFEIASKRKRGEITENQESMATQICHESLLELKTIIAQVTAESPVAIGASLEGDEFPLVTLGAELCLKDSGWSATSLGANQSVNSILQSVTGLQPSFIWVSAVMVKDQASFIARLRELSDSMIKAIKVTVIGEGGMEAEIKKQLPTVHYGKDFAQLVTLARFPGEDSGR